MQVNLSLSCTFAQDLIDCYHLLPPRRALPLVTAKQNDTQQGKPKPVGPVEKVNKNQVGKNSCYSLY